MKDQFYNYILKLQQQITAKLQEIDGKSEFQSHEWERPGGGGGKTMVIENGGVFEKGGVNISRVHGKLPESMQKALNVTAGDFYACGLSMVIHPTSPKIPTTHANWRYFELYDEQGNVVDQWFGGGQDLTPYYLDKGDCIHWHQICKDACDRNNPDFYKKYKKWCDEYFWNKHRNESRGIGGLFFDYLRPTKDFDLDHLYDFVSAVGDSFLEAYVPIVEKHKTESYTPEQREWQEIRRGRYVEFNLVYDRGTLFGLKTNGRIESILMSLPPYAQWKYDYHPEPGSREEELLKVLEKPIDWL